MKRLMTSNTIELPTDSDDSPREEELNLRD